MNYKHIYNIYIYECFVVKINIINVKKLLKRDKNHFLFNLLVKILDISVNIVYNNECEKNYYPLYNRFSQKLSCCAAGRLFYVLCSEKYYHSFMSLIIKYFCAIIDIDKDTAVSGKVLLTYIRLSV